MSEYMGELFVRITPDATGFDATLKKQIDQSASRAAANPGGATAAQAKALTNQVSQAVREAERLRKAAETTGAQFALGAATEKQAASALLAYGNAGQYVAKANVALALATGQAITAGDLHVLSLKQEQQALARAGAQAQTFRSQLRNVATGKAGVGSLLNPKALLGFGVGGLAVGALFQGLQHASEALKVTGDEAATTEGKLRNFGAALVTGDVVGGVIALTKHTASASENLKKLQDDAGTTSVDLRNYAQAANEGADKSQALAAAQREIGSSFIDPDKLDRVTDSLRRNAEAAAALANAYETSVTAVQDVSAAIDRAGSDAAAFGERVRGAGAVAAEAARAGAIPQGAPVDSTATNATANATAEANARSDRERLAVARKAQAQAKQLLQNEKGITEGTATLKLQYAQARQKADAIAQSIQDKSDTAAKSAADTANAVAEANARSDAQRLAVSEREQAQAKTSLGRLEKSDEGYSETLLAYAQARQKTDSIKQTLRDAASAAAEKASSEAAQAANEAQRAYEQQVSNNVQRLKVAADAAGNTGKTEKALLGILARESKDRRLAEDQRLQYAQELTNERQDQARAVAEAAKADIDYRKSLLDLSVQRAETLAPNNTADDRKAYRAQIAFFTRLRDQAKSLGKAGREAVVEYQSQIVALKGKLKGAQGGGNAFTLQQLFQEAADEFNTFGSNIAPRGGVLSGQDARGAFAATVLKGKNPGSAEAAGMSPRGGVLSGRDTQGAFAQLVQDQNPAQAALVGVGQSQLTEAQKQTLLLQGILDHFSRGGGGYVRPDRVGVARERGSLTAIETAKLAAAYQFGAN